MDWEGHAARTRRPDVLRIWETPPHTLGLRHLVCAQIGVHAFESVYEPDFVLKRRGSTHTPVWSERPRPRAAQNASAWVSTSAY